VNSDFLYKFYLKHFPFQEEFNKCPLFFSDFNKTRIFSRDFRKIFKCQISRKSVQWEPRFSMRRTAKRTDRQTHTRIAKLILAPKICVELRFSSTVHTSILQDLCPQSKHFNNQILASRKTHSITITTINTSVMFRDK
jgi:hypothetical protein